MKLKLKDIASLQTGLFAKPQAEGEILYLQVKHFAENGTLNTNIYPDLKGDKVAKKHLLRTGDILFAAKGAKNFATVFKGGDMASVASTSFFVIRLFDNSLLPEFLAWFLNHPTTMKMLKEQASGSSMVSISKAVLEDMELPMPSMELQKKIIHITALRKRQKELQQQIDQLSETQIQQQIIKAII